MKPNIRLEYRDNIVSLQKITKGSVLNYEDPLYPLNAWKDLVLRDYKGLEIARVMTYGKFRNSDLRYYNK